MKNNHTLLPFKQHLQTLHNTHSTTTGFNGTASSHHTTLGDGPAKEDVPCFSSLSTNKTSQACATLRAKWTYLSLSYLEV